VTNHLDVRSVERAKEVELQVGRRHLPVRRDLLGEQPGDRAVPASDLQAPRVARDAEPLDAPRRQGIQPLLEQRQPVRFVLAECGKA
jgi:hypothetical protein